MGVPRWWADVRSDALRGASGRGVRRRLRVASLAKDGVDLLVRRDDKE
jgi:hypothetical protein